MGLQFTSLIVLYMLTLLQFMLQNRVARLAKEFKRFSRDQIASDEQIDALFVTYHQILLTINASNKYLQVCLRILHGFS